MAAGRYRPWLLAVEVVAATWISNSASSSSPEQMRMGVDLMLLACVDLRPDFYGICDVYGSEQAASSQESVNCMPCSRTYIADAYLDPLASQLARRCEVPGSADLCKGLANDPDVPTLLEFHRQLVGEGSHRRLVYSVKFGNCQDTMVNFLDGFDANLVVIKKLPSGVFAYPFELQHFVERKVFLDVAVFWNEVESFRHFMFDCCVAKMCLWRHYQEHGSPLISVIFPYNW